MKKILKFLSVFSALILSVFGLTACDQDNNQAMYGVILDPSMDPTIQETEIFEEPLKEPETENSVSIIEENELENENPVFILEEIEIDTNTEDF